MKKILITESQLKFIIETSHLEWFDPETNEAFENITDEKIIEAFEHYGLTADKNVCSDCKIEYHPQGDVMVFYDTYSLDGEFDDDILQILQKISDEIGAEQMIYMEPGYVKFLFYSETKSIERY